MDRLTDTPRVSVIVLAMNQESTVGKTLDSILAQHLTFPIEIIIGDDDSTDRTRTVCETYAVRFPHIVRLMPKSPRKGILRNYFDCLKASRGEFIADCSADDIWPSADHLQQHVAMLDSREDLTAVAGDWLVGNVLHRAADTVTAADVLCADVDLPIVLSASTYRASVIKQQINKILEAGYPAEDYPVYIELLKAGSIERCPGVALKYSEHDGSVSRPKSAEDCRRFQIGALDMRLRLALEANIDQQNLSRTLNHRLDYITKLTFKIGRGFDELRGLESRVDVYRPSLQSRLLHFAMRIPVLWNFLRSLLP